MYMSKRRLNINPDLLTSDALGPILAEVPERMYTWRIKAYEPHVSEYQQAGREITRWVAARLEEEFPNKKNVKPTAEFIRLSANMPGKGGFIGLSSFDGSGVPEIDPDFDFTGSLESLGFKLPRQPS